MASKSTSSVQMPLRDPVIQDNKFVSRSWEVFLRSLKSLLDPLGSEKSFSLTNNQSSAASIEGLSFDSKHYSQVMVDYLIQRVTTGTGAIEKIETGCFYLVYQPTSNAWVLSNGPTTSGITLSVASSGTPAVGQVQYVSTNEAGTASISKIVFRPRTLAGKNYQYSSV